jgi:hypothetical protein
VYEVNPWLWQFGSGKPRLGDLTAKETTERKKAARDERLKRGWETRRHRKAADFEVKSCLDLFVSVYHSIYLDVLYHESIYLYVHVCT